MDRVPVQAAAMGGCGEEKLWLAQGKTLRDPRPDVPHLLGTDDLRGEGVWVKCQLHIPSGEAPNIRTQAEIQNKRQIKQLVMHKPLKIIQTR